MRSNRPSRPARERAVRALRHALLSSHPAASVDEAGYAASWHQNLVPAVKPEDFEADFRQGSGSELESKFRAAHSSSALAVNSFGPFRRSMSDLKLGAHRGFTSMAFEKKCFSGLAGTPPNLDLLLEGSDGIIGIESKCTEYLSPKAASFSDAYFHRIEDDRRESGWFQEMVRLEETPRAYQCLDAAQLIKHAFGLAKVYRDLPVTLLYLWWEPANPGADPIYDRHRGEAEEFAERVAGSYPAFEVTTYASLWAGWASDDSPGWLATHLRDLGARYAVTI